MKKARYTSGLVILILLIALVQWPMGEAIVPDSQTISIIDTHDDKFITEAGIGIDAWLCHILDPTMDIISYLVFRDVEVNNWEPLENATLRFRTTVNQDFDADSSVTIYGMKFSDLQDEGIINPPFVLSVPYTSASVTRNTSQFYGQQWHEVNVTNIVEELIRSYDWDGDGHAGVETGDSIGFVILGAEGYDTRWFIDYHYGTPSLATQLVIHWNHEPAPPTDPPLYYDFNQTYGNFTIWREIGYEYPVLDPVEYIFSEGGVPPYDVMYDTVHSPPGTPVQISTSESPSPTSIQNQRKLIRLSNGTLHTVYFKRLGSFYQIYEKRSDDNGTTWIGEIRISNFTDMEDYDQQYPAIAVDSNDTLHVIWYGKASGYTTETQIWYVNYTDSWSTPIHISTYAGMDILAQRGPSITIGPEDYLHVVWYGCATGYPPIDYQIWYTKYTNTWSAPIRISTYAGMDTGQQFAPIIAMDSNGYLHLVWNGEATGYIQEQIWYVNYTDSWSAPIRISTYDGMITYPQMYTCIASDPSDYLYVVWTGKATGFTYDPQVWYANYTDSWSYPFRISTYAGMYTELQYSPSMAIDEDAHIHITWYGKATGFVDAYKIWYAKYENGWFTPECLQQIGQNLAPNMRWNRYPANVDYTFFIADANGTIIMGNGFILNFTDIQDVYDWIDTEDPRPTDPDPPGWPTEGYFIRFRMRLYFLIIGFGCLFGPILFFAWKRPSGYYILCGAILMLMGIGMLISIGQV